MFKILIKIIFIIFFNQNLFSYEVVFSGNDKLSLDDLQTLSKININKKDLSSNDINILIKDLYSADLIYDLDLKYFKNKAQIYITEAKIINQIYINGNINIDDDLLIKQISSSAGKLLSKDNLKDDLDKIRTIYLYKGYSNASFDLNTELISEDRVNLIFSINEGTPSKIINIDFIGNKFFSDSYLNNKIISKKVSPLNIFTKSSNVDKSIFYFDIEQISNLYKRYGFFDVKVNYELHNNGNNTKELQYIIDEKNRYQISDIKFNITFHDDPTKKIIEKLKDDFSKNNYLYNQQKLEKYLNLLNEQLKSNYAYNYYLSYFVKLESDKLIVTFQETELDQVFINKIDIQGNSITKENTIRSKLKFEPGDIYNDYLIDQTKEKLSSFRYINQINIENIINDKYADIIIKIDENKKTGNFMFGGSLSGDTGLGLALSINDYNFLGSGNELISSFNINSEKYLFDISYIEYPAYSSTLKNTYNVYNSEDDYTDSFGFKSRRYGLGYGISFDYNEKINLSSKINYYDEKNFSQINSSSPITDNIGNFNSIDLDFTIIRNTTNDVLYPTNGSYNKFSIIYSPEISSNNSYYKFIYKNNIYKTIDRNDSFVYASNNIGYAESVTGNLRTINTFSLGGNNFKGFEYRGIGPFDDNIYLGGNKFVSSTLGYGDNFLFDEKDNIIMKIFYTTGSIWGSDYSNDDFELRSSIGASLDFKSVIPVTLSYAIPLKKNPRDKTKKFNFFLGTSF